MATFTQTVDVSGTAAYPASPQVTIPFIPKTITVVCEDSTDDAWVSFDGSTDAAHMVPGTPDQRLVFNQRVTKVWLKRGAAGAAPTNVQVMAEAY
jgi:hypothetical protein